MTKRDEAEQDYLAGMKYKDIADKYGVTINTVKSWRTRHWNKSAPPNEKRVHTKTEKGAHKKEVHPAVQELADSDLNDKQKAFVSEYVRLANATQAYINAYGVSYDIANVNGNRLLVNASIQTEIKRLRQARLAELGIGVFELIDDMAKEARADIRDFADWGSDEFEAIDEESSKQYTRHKSWVALKDSDSVDSWAVKKVTVGKDGPIVELHDRNKARDKLLEYLNGKGVFAGTEEKQKVVNDDSLLNAIKKSSKEVFEHDDDIES